MGSLGVWGWALWGMLLSLILREFAPKPFLDGDAIGRGLEYMEIEW